MPVHLSAITVIEVIIILIDSIKQWRNKTVLSMHVKVTLLHQISNVLTCGRVTISHKIINHRSI